MHSIASMVCLMTLRFRPSLMFGIDSIICQTPLPGTGRKRISRSIETFHYRNRLYRSRVSMPDSRSSGRTIEKRIKWYLNGDVTIKAGCVKTVLARGSNRRHSQLESDSERFNVGCGIRDG